VVDAAGNPVKEKGFYIFKNSWGTGNFGRDNVHGDGYGFISARYIHEYGSVYISDLPVVEQPREACDNDSDDDGDGAADCDDSDCTAAPECATGGGTAHSFAATGLPVAIPDNDAVGVASEIAVAVQGPIRKLTANVAVTHTYRSDLRVTLRRGDKTVTLHDRTGGGQDNLALSATVADFDGTDMTGTWRLVVEDRAGYDTGTLDAWSLDVLTD
jgi:hypothetical protein